MKKLVWMAFLTAAACDSTRIVNSWKDPDASVNPQQLNKVMVAALVKDETSRRVAEDKMASFNPSFRVSYQIFTSKEIMDNQDHCRAVLKEQGFDGIITMRLVSDRKEETFVPYQGNYWGYHPSYYPGYYESGYYREDTNYIIETNVFSLKQDKLLWSGITSTINPPAIDKTILDVLNVVKRQMIKDKFIKN